MKKKDRQIYAHKEDERYLAILFEKLANNRFILPFKENVLLILLAFKLLFLINQLL
ncbi:TPA: hypothetical protein OUB70_002483 [Enterococcus faecalis]|nr:hypothetical protein [Enterococcus faecalis]